MHEHAAFQHWRISWPVRGVATRGPCQLMQKNNASRWEFSYCIEIERIGGRIIYNLGCCSNTFLAGLFRRLRTVIFVILHCLVHWCLLPCSVYFALVFCYFCARVLFILLSRSVIFALVLCYFCPRVLLFSLLCSVFFRARVLLYLRSGSAGFVFALCF